MIMQSDVGLELLTEEFGRKSAHNLACLVPINVIRASRSLLSRVLQNGPVDLRLELVPKVRILLVVVCIGLLLLVEQSALVGDLLGALAGLIDLPNSLAVFWRFDHHHDDLSRQIVGDGGVVPTRHVFELGQNASNVAHPIMYRRS